MVAVVDGGEVVELLFVVESTSVSLNFALFLFTLTTRFTPPWETPVSEEDEGVDGVVVETLLVTVAVEMDGVVVVVVVVVILLLLELLLLTDSFGGGGDDCVGSTARVLPFSLPVIGGEVVDD